MSEFQMAKFDETGYPTLDYYVYLLKEKQSRALTDDELEVIYLIYKDIKNPSRKQALCKICGKTKFKQRVRIKREGKRDKLKHVDKQGRCWVGKICPKCNIQRSVDFYKKVRLRKRLDNMTKYINDSLNLEKRAKNNKDMFNRSREKPSDDSIES